MHLNPTQDAAIDVLNKVMLQKSSTAPADISDDVATLRVYQLSHRQNPDQIMLGSWQSDLGKELLKGLPGVITPEFKQRLRTLAEFDKAGADATPEQQQAAVEAYQAVGKTLKVAVAKTLISYGIKTGLADTPAAPVAGVIANVASGPLAEMVVATSEASSALQQKLINIALVRMGREPIESGKQDEFMARMLGKFSDGILQEIEKRGSAAPSLHLQRASSAAVEQAGVAGEWNR
jgi:hypothetical protein